jgi:nucleotide-binding universal stress UspA family protein
MSHQKIAIALPVEENLLYPFYQWGYRFDWSHLSEVHLIHIVKKNVTPLEFGLVEMPDEKTYQSMVPTLNKHMKDEAGKIIPSTFSGEIYYHLAREFSPEDYMIDTLKQLNATLLVVSTRGKHGFEGLFYSSFTDKMVKYSPCDVYVVRPLPEKP